MKRVLILVLGVLAIVMLMSGIAQAATWEDIRADLIVDGHLDGEYTPGELQSYLNNAMEAEYNSIVQGQLNQIVDSDTARDTFPFTGFQLMMAGIVAVVLVGGGVALRHFSRPQRS